MTRGMGIGFTASIALSAVFCMAAADAAATLRTEAADGDVSLQGPIGLTFERMFRNHVLAEDPVYLSACFKERTETSLWQTEFWGKYMHSAVPFWTATGCAQLKERIDAGVANVIAAQLPDGYIGNYREDRRSPAGGWDVWGIKYTMLGLLHYYDATRSEAALAACRRLCA